MMAEPLIATSTAEQEQMIALLIDVLPGCCLITSRTPNSLSATMFQGFHQPDNDEQTFSIRAW
jgi:hypothetical protein